MKNCAILFLLFLVMIGCGRQDSRSSLSSYPSLEEDPNTLGLREKFKTAKAVTENNKSFLALGERRTCTFMDATHGEFIVEDFEAVFTHEAGGAIRMTNSASAPERKELKFYFSASDLIASTKLKEESIQMTSVLRLTQGYNDIVIEEAGKFFGNDSISYPASADSYVRKKILSEQASFEKKHAVSIWAADRRATGYIFCSGMQGYSGGETSTFGACRSGTDDGVMNSEEGGCYSFDLGLVFSASSGKKYPYSDGTEVFKAANLIPGEAPKNNVGQESPTDASDPSIPVPVPVPEAVASGATDEIKTALQYCDQLRESGFKDWRLPDIRELREVAGPIATTYFNFSVFDAPEASTSLETAVLPPADFWALNMGNNNAGWTVKLDYKRGEKRLDGKKSENFQDKLKFLASVICVRKPMDYDGDHIPTSSDACPDTAAGVEVHRTGDSKGCAIQNSAPQPQPSEKKGAN